MTRYIGRHNLVLYVHISNICIYKIYYYQALFLFKKKIHSYIHSHFYTNFHSDFLIIVFSMHPFSFPPFAFSTIDLIEIFLRFIFLIGLINVIIVFEMKS